VMRENFADIVKVVWMSGWMVINSKELGKQVRGWKDVFAVLGSPCLLPVSFIERSRRATFSLPIYAPDKLASQFGGYKRVMDAVFPN
jgi:hypothetical protein